MQWGEGFGSPPLGDKMLVDESNFTPWAALGWHAWDEWSPEEEFCQFVSVMQKMLRPSVVLETGVGVGRMSGYIDRSACTYLGFESDPEWLQPPAALGEPTAEDIKRADLLVLDSDPAYRIRELAMWSLHGKPGSVCIVHDAGNGHPPGSNHDIIRRAIEATGIAGIYLANPRGGWLAAHP